MQTQQLIQASADVVTITHLAPGDVYKRVEEGGAYSGAPGATLRFGVVQDVMNNGTDSAVTALEYVPAPSYASGVTVEMKVHTGSKPAAIFAATPAEVTQHLAEVVAAAEKAVDKAEAEATRARAALKAVQETVYRAGHVHPLSAPATAGPAEVQE